MRIVMGEDVRLTKLASCAGCGAKVGAGVLSSLLRDFRTHTDPRLIVGFDRSDDASVYVLDENTALIQTVDFFPPVVDEPFLYGQIAAANAISDIYAMGGEPRLALNVLCAAEAMEPEWIREILRGGYEKAYEAGVILTGGHSVHGAEPLYGMAVTGFAHPDGILTNSGARPGDVLVLTKRLGTGILMTAARADLVSSPLMERMTDQMTALNRTARDVMVLFPVHSCTDVTGFGLIGHSCEMAQGSGCTIHLMTGGIPYFPEAVDMADMGFVPAGAYRNREFAEVRTRVRGEVPRALQDLLYDPQTSGGLLIALPEEAAAGMTDQMREAGLEAGIIGYVTEQEDAAVILEG